MGILSRSTIVTCRLAKVSIKEKKHKHGFRVLRRLAFYLKNSKFNVFYLNGIAQSVYRPLDKQKVYTSCSDALVRGGIVPNPGQPVSIIFKVNIFLY